MMSSDTDTAAVYRSAHNPPPFPLPLSCSTSRCCYMVLSDVAAQTFWVTLDRLG
jgi:hypothetical protein